MLKTLLLLCLIPFSSGFYVNSKYNQSLDNDTILKRLAEPFVRESVGHFDTSETEAVYITITVKNELFDLEDRERHYYYRDHLNVKFKSNDANLEAACVEIVKDHIYIPEYSYKNTTVHVDISCDLKKEPEPTPTSEQPDYTLYFDIVIFVLGVILIITVIYTYRAALAQIGIEILDYIIDRLSRLFR